jgi:hypothetical protein
MRFRALIGTVILLSISIAGPSLLDGKQCGSASITDLGQEVLTCDGLTLYDTAPTIGHYKLTSTTACRYTSGFGGQLATAQSGHFYHTDNGGFLESKRRLHLG